MQYLQKTCLYLTLFFLSLVLPISVSASNCIWIQNTTCQSISGKTNTWTDADLASCNQDTKPSGSGTKCCCGQIVSGCCQKTRTDNNIVSTVNTTAAKCHQMDNDAFDVVFYEDQKAVMNKCLDKDEIESCRWQTIEPGEMSKNKTPQCAADKKQATDNSKCGNPARGTESQPRICCCGTKWENDIEPEFIAPILQTPFPGLKLTATTSLGEKLQEDGSYLILIPWIAEYVKALYDYSMDIAILLAGAAIMAGGLIWLVSGGDAGRITKAKNLLAGSFIGLLILLCAYLIFSQVNPDINVLKPIPLGNIKPIEIPVTAAYGGMVKVGVIKDNMHFAGIGSEFALPRMINKDVYCPAADTKYTQADYKEKIKKENIDTIINEIEKIAESFVQQDANVGYEATAYNCEFENNYGKPGGNDSIRNSCDHKNDMVLKNLKVNINRFDCGGWVGYVYACAGLAVPGGPTFDALLHAKDAYGAAKYGPIKQYGHIVKNKVGPGDFFGEMKTHAMLKSKKGGYFDCGGLNPETNAGCTRYHNNLIFYGSENLVTIHLEDIIQATREKFYDCPEC